MNTDGNDAITYQTTSVDATKVGTELKGLRTMICSFHHMTPENAKKILQTAKASQQPICVYEISDNAPPNFVNFLTLPLTFIVCLVVTLFVRPMTWQQVVFTYLIPILPICFAWDGAVSNVRTYTMKDMDELLEGWLHARNAAHGQCLARSPSKNP